MDTNVVNSSLYLSLRSGKDCSLLITKLFNELRIFSNN